MKLLGTCLARIPAAAGAAILLGLLADCKPSRPPAVPAKPAPVAPAKPSAPVANPVELTAQFHSFFNDAPPPGNIGRDPFFPNSTRRNPVEVVHKTAAAVSRVDPVFKLGGVVGKPGRRLAVINSSYILAVGEEADVRLPGGEKVRIKVVEIGEDYAVVTVEGQPGQKRLDMSPNKSP